MFYVHVHAIQYRPWFGFDTYVANKSTLFHPTEIYTVEDLEAIDQALTLQDAAISRVPLCTRLLQNHRDATFLLLRDPSRLLTSAACILNSRGGRGRGSATDSTLLGSRRRQSKCLCSGARALGPSGARATGGKVRQRVIWR